MFILNLNLLLKTKTYEREVASLVQFSYGNSTARKLLQTSARLRRTLTKQGLSFPGRCPLFCPLFQAFFLSFLPQQISSLAPASVSPIFPNRKATLQFL